jgi:hypothetical protein
MRSLLQEVWRLPLRPSSNALKMAQLSGPRKSCTVKSGHLHTTARRARRARSRYSYRSLSIASLVIDSAFILQHTGNTRAARMYLEHLVTHSFDGNARPQWLKSHSRRHWRLCSVPNLRTGIEMLTSKLKTGANLSCDSHALHHRLGSYASLI